LLAASWHSIAGGKSSDNHRLSAAKPAMTNYLLIVEHFMVRASSASPAAQAKFRRHGRDKTTRRANHPKVCKARLEKIF
jgi:hypothetical protein